MPVLGRLTAGAVSGAAATALLAGLCFAIAPAAAHAAGTDPSLCPLTSSRLNVPAGYPINVCWDGSHVVIKNTTTFVLHIAASGNIGSTSRSSLNGDPAGAVIAAIDSDPAVLPPSWAESVSVGSGQASFTVEGNSYNVEYAKLKALEGFIPGNLFADYQAISDLVDEFSSDVSTFEQCKKGANFIEVAACSASFGWNVNFAIDRFDAHVGVELLSHSLSLGALLNLIDTALWASDAVSSFEDLSSAPKTFSISAAQAPPSAPSAPDRGGSSPPASVNTPGGGGGGNGGGSPTVSLSQGPTAPYGYRYAVSLSGFAPGSSVGMECFDSVSTGGFFHFDLTANSGGTAFTQSECYSGDGPDHWVTANGLESNHVAWGGHTSPPAPTQPPPTSPQATSPPQTAPPQTSPPQTSPPATSPPPPPPHYETTGGPTHTWTNYTNAGGTEGPTIPSYTTVQIACRLTGFKVADGNTWWYRIAQSPWNNQYYASADAFYNNGQTSGSLHGTPWVDSSVPTC